ncbi:MAG: acyltransferase [Planctomycetaceae bacterium]
MSPAIDRSIAELPRAVVSEPFSHGESAANSPAALIAKSDRHIDGFDLVRVFSAFNVVLFHVLAVRNGLWGRGSVIAFVMIAATLPAMRPDLGRFGKYTRRRAHRILLPWAVWSVVYGLIELTRYLHSGRLPGWTWSNLLIGTSEHLWFFVYIFIASILLWGMLRVFRNVPLTVAATGLTLIAAPMIVINAHSPPFFDGTPPFGIWWRCFPAILLGISLGFAQRMGSKSKNSRSILFTGSVVLLAAAVSGATGSLTMMFSYGVPAILLPAAMLLPWKNGRFVDFVADVSMGIYATHPLMLLVVRHFWGDALSPLVSAPMVFVGALAISKGIKRLPGGRILV